MLKLLMLLLKQNCMTLGRLCLCKYTRSMFLLCSISSCVKTRLSNSSCCHFLGFWVEGNLRRYLLQFPSTNCYWHSLDEFPAGSHKSGGWTCWEIKTVSKLIFAYNHIYLHRAITFISLQWEEVVWEERHSLKPPASHSYFFKLELVSTAGGSEPCLSSPGPCTHAIIHQVRGQGERVQLAVLLVDMQKYCCC